MGPLNLLLISVEKRQPLALFGSVEAPMNAMDCGVKSRSIAFFWFDELAAAIANLIVYEFNKLRESLIQRFTFYEFQYILNSDVRPNYQVQDFQGI